MAQVPVSKSHVAPLRGAVIRNIEASASGKVGDVVRIHTDFGARPASAADAETADSYGIVTAIGCEGAIEFDAGDGLSVVVHGPVCGFANSAPGTLYLADAPGQIADEAGTVERAVAIVESDEVVFVLAPAPLDAPVAP